MYRPYHIDVQCETLRLSALYPPVANRSRGHCQCNLDFTLEYIYIYIYVYIVAEAGFRPLPAQVSTFLHVYLLADPFTYLCVGRCRSIGPSWPIYLSICPSTHLYLPTSLCICLAMYTRRLKRKRVFADGVGYGVFGLGAKDSLNEAGQWLSVKGDVFSIFGEHDRVWMRSWGVPQWTETQTTFCAAFGSSCKIRKVRLHWEAGVCQRGCGTKGAELIQRCFS